MACPPLLPGHWKKLHFLPKYLHYTFHLKMARVGVGRRMISIFYGILTTMYQTMSIIDYYLDPIINTIITPILQMGKLRIREESNLASDRDRF